MKRARRILEDYPELRTVVSDVNAIGGSGQDSRTFQMSIQGPDLEQLAQYSETLVER